MADKQDLMNNFNKLQIKLLFSKLYDTLVEKGYNRVKGYENVHLTSDDEITVLSLTTLDYKPFMVIFKPNSKIIEIQNAYNINCINNVDINKLDEVITSYINAITNAETIEEVDMILNTGVI